MPNIQRALSGDEQQLTIFDRFDGTEKHEQITKISDENTINVY